MVIVGFRTSCQVILYRLTQSRQEVYETMCMYGRYQNWEQRKFPCEQCPKRFSTARNLKRHMKVHAKNQVAYANKFYYDK